MSQHFDHRPGQAQAGLAGAAQSAASKALGASVLAVGTDLVSIPEFEGVLSTPGSKFSSEGRVFTPREFRRAQNRAKQKGDSPAVHMAALWALKEAALKAWLAALSAQGHPPPLTAEQVAWSQITVLHDAAGAPSIRLVKEMEDAFLRSVGQSSGNYSWRASASHDGDYAIAVVALIRER